jgi:hypothetical protein
MPSGTRALGCGHHDGNTWNGQGPRALGFFRTGVSAIEDDPGAAGMDAFGSPLFPPAAGGGAEGAFKSPGLRNVELTGPYFHTGSAATLEQVMEFYARNGDVPAGGNLGPGMGNIRLNQRDRAEIRRVSQGADRRAGPIRASAVRSSIAVARDLLARGESTRCASCPTGLFPGRPRRPPTCGARRTPAVGLVRANAGARSQTVCRAPCKGIPARDGSRAHHAFIQPCVP